MNGLVSIKTADFDGDGTPDAATCTNNGVFVVDVERKQVRGGSLGGAPCVDFAIGDVDNQKGLDIVVVTNGSTASVIRNNGTGGFEPVTNAGSGIQFISVALGFIDGDSNLDLMLGDNESGPPSGIQRSMLGNGSGGFGAITNSNIAAAPVSTILGELDGEPGTDAVVLSGNASAMGLLEGNGAGGFTNDGGVDTSDTDDPMGARSLVITKADANPLLDYALVHNAPDELAVIRNFAGAETVLADRIVSSFATEAGPQSVVSADLDGDGNEDLIVACKNAALGAVQVFYGDGNGDYVPVRFDVPSPVGVAVDDFNGDLLPDVVVASADGKVYVFYQEAR